MNNAYIRINGEVKTASVFVSHKITSLEDIQKLVFSIGGDVILVQYEGFGETLYALTYMSFQANYKISLNFTYQVESEEYFNKLLIGLNGKKVSNFESGTLLTLIDNLYLIAPDEKN